MRRSRRASVSSVFNCNCILTVIGFILFMQSEVLAIKVELRPDQLIAESKLIVVGEVQSYRLEDEGSNKIVLLEVAVESIAKGEEIAKPGDVIEVRCSKPVKPSADGYYWEQGNEFIPDRHGKAKFFLVGPRGKTWESLSPNGIEALDDIPGLQFKREPPNPPPVDSQESVRNKPKETAADNGSTTLWYAMGAAATIVIGMILLRIVKSMQRS